MSAEDLTLAFHALLGQFQGEQIYIDDLNECLSSHANDLDGFRSVGVSVETRLQTLDMKQDEFEVKMRQQLYDMQAQILQGPTEAISHLSERVVADQKELYHKISEERNTHVTENENILRKELEVFEVKLQTQFVTLNGLINAGRTPTISGYVPTPPGMQDVNGFAARLEGMADTLSCTVVSAQSLAEKVNLVEYSVATLTTDLAHVDGNARHEIAAMQNHLGQLSEAVSSAATTTSGAAAAPAGFGPATIGGQLGAGWQSTFQAAAQPQTAQPQVFPIDTPPVVEGYGKPATEERSGYRKPDWKLYDEKYAQQPHNYFNAKDPQGWLLTLGDYLAGRTNEVDAFLKWVSEQPDELTLKDLYENYEGCMDNERSDVSRQLWALLSSLLQDDAEQMLTFRNVERHNGAEAWRRMTEPILEGRDLRKKQYQPRVLRPRPAAKIDDIPGALVQWESDCRLFRESGGQDMEDEQKRLILIEMLPPDIAVYITLHMSAYPLSAA